MTEIPCIIAVPSILMVDPSGRVNELTLLETPNDSSECSSAKGRAALEEAVDRQILKIGENFFRNTLGRSFPINKSIPIYTIIKCKPNARTTFKTYLISGISAEKPKFAKVVDNNAKTPYGANFIITCTS